MNNLLIVERMFRFATTMCVGLNITCLSNLPQNLFIKIDVDLDFTFDIIRVILYF